MTMGKNLQHLQEPAAQTQKRTAVGKELSIPWHDN